MGIDHRFGVREYWIVDWRHDTIEVNRYGEGVRELSGTLLAEDTLTSPLLPGFKQKVSDLCAQPV